MFSVLFLINILIEWVALCFSQSADFGSSVREWSALCWSLVTTVRLPWCLHALESRWYFQHGFVLMTSRLNSISFHPLFPQFSRTVRQSHWEDSNVDCSYNHQMSELVETLTNLSQAGIGSRIAPMARKHIPGCRFNTLLREACAVDVSFTELH